MRLKGNEVGEPDVFEKRAIFGCSRACVVGGSHICDSRGSHSRIDAKLERVGFCLVAYGDLQVLSKILPQ